MKLVCFIKDGHEQLALLVNDTLYNMENLHPELPSTMSMFLNYWEDYFPIAKAINESILHGKISLNQGIPLASASLISPVPLPSACQDIEAFTNLLDKAEQLPVSYFNNHHGVQGAGEVTCMPDHLKKLDFEMGIAVVICSHGRNIGVGEADQYIGGFMIRNGISARRNNSSARGKDVAIVLGPLLVTPDELEDLKVPAKEGHTGNNYNMAMRCRVNDELISESNMCDMNWTFAEIIASCAYGTDIQPGDIIGSGPIGTGRHSDPESPGKWLQAGDVVEIEIEGLGISTCTIVAEESEYSLMIN